MNEVLFPLIGCSCEENKSVVDSVGILRDSGCCVVEFNVGDPRPISSGISVKLFGFRVFDVGCHLGLLDVTGRRSRGWIWSGISRRVS